MSNFVNQNGTAVSEEEMADQNMPLLSGNDFLSEAFFKKTGALLINISNYEKKKGRFEPRIMLSFMKGLGDMKYDKENKLLMSLSYEESFKFLRGLKSLIKGEITQTEGIVHSSGDRMYKTLFLLSGTRGYSFGVKSMSNGAERTVTVNFSNEELFFLFFTISKLFYYCTTGSLVGFSANWI